MKVFRSLMEVLYMDESLHKLFLITIRFIFVNLYGIQISSKVEDFYVRYHLYSVIIIYSLFSRWLVILRT